LGRFCLRATLSHHPPTPTSRFGGAPSAELKELRDESASLRRERDELAAALERAQEELAALRLEKEEMAVNVVACAEGSGEASVKE